MEKFTCGKKNFETLISNQRYVYLNNGCSWHMIGDKSKFLSLISIDGGHVIFRDNTKGKIIDKGRVGKFKHSCVENVLLVKRLRHNLLSISQLCDRGKKSHL